MPGLDTSLINGEEVLNIDCKYYTASLRIKRFTDPGPQANFEDGEGIIICFDTENVCPREIESLFR